MAADVQSNHWDKDTFQLFLTLPRQRPPSALLPSLLSLTADHSCFSLCSTPPKTFLSLSHSFSLHLGHRLPLPPLHKFYCVKEAGITRLTWSYMEESNRPKRGTDTRSCIFTHALWKGCGKQKSLSFMEGPSFPPSKLQKLLSEEKPEKYFLFHIGAKLASNVGVS